MHSDDKSGFSLGGEQESLLFLKVFFFFFFKLWTVFKAFIGFGAVLLLLYVLVLWP